MFRHLQLQTPLHNPKKACAVYKSKAIVSMLGDVVLVSYRSIDNLCVVWCACEESNVKVRAGKNARGFNWQT